MAGSDFGGESRIERGVKCRFGRGWRLAGVALGMLSVRYVESLFYQVKATDLQMLAIPALAILAGAFLAALRPVIQAVRIDPASILRAE